jgi:uncharacterized protein YutE (UPF0331/DUF86 family)
LAPPNKNLIREKQDVVYRCLQRIQSRMPTSLEELETDFDRQDIIVLNLERAVQACVDIASHFVAYTSLPSPVRMADSFAALERAGMLSSAVSERMQKAVGLRNLLVHEYKKTDWAILWAVLQNHLHDFVRFCEEIDKL